MSLKSPEKTEGRVVFYQVGLLFPFLPSGDKMWVFSFIQSRMEIFVLGGRTKYHESDVKGNRAAIYRYVSILKLWSGFNSHFSRAAAARVNWLRSCFSCHHLRHDGTLKLLHPVQSVVRPADVGKLQVKFIDTNFSVRKTPMTVRVFKKRPTRPPNMQHESHTDHSHTSGWFRVNNKGSTHHVINATHTHTHTHTHTQRHAVKIIYQMFN